MAEGTNEGTAKVVVQQLAPDQGGVLKTWSFQDKTTIAIGRGDDQDVEVVDPYVSRTHAVLESRDGSWFLVAHGRNGVYVDNQPIQERPITRSVTFRLGSSGPLLSFQTTAQQNESLATLSFETLPMSLFAVDESRLENEVGQIAGRDDFVRLQEQARALRLKKKEHL
jgi:pSer/pThr/pTyr-binding forkhead associated (FHA) protein